jgi:hypothetical protein
MADDPTPADRHRQRLDLAVVPEAEHKKVLDERDEERVYNREKQQRILEGIVREEALKRQRDEAQAALRKAELERDELRADLFIPGEQECPECGFSLSKLSMRAADGAVGVNAAAPLEPCPNGCGPMIGVTWKRGCTNLGRVAEEMSTLRQAAEVRADTAEADVKHWRDSTGFQTPEEAWRNVNQVRGREVERARREALEGARDAALLLHAKDLDLPGGPVPTADERRIWIHGIAKGHGGPPGPGPD